MSENQYRKNTFHALVGYVLLFISLNARYEPPRNIFKKYSTAHLLYNIYGHRCFFVFYSQTKINFSVFYLSKNDSKESHKCWAKRDRNYVLCGTYREQINFQMGYVLQIS